MKKGKGKNSGLLPNSLKIISSCIKTVSTNASTVVRTAGASVAASISASTDDQRDQVIWAGFDRLENGSASFRHVLLLGYQTGFQVIDVEDASDFTELVSKRGGPVTFLQLMHIPAKSDGSEKTIRLHPILIVVAGDEATRSGLGQNRTYMNAPGRDGSSVYQSGTTVDSPTVVQFYSLKSNCYVKVLRFRSTVFMVRCSPLTVAVGLENEIHCLDAVTLENKFTIPTYPVPRSGEQGIVGVNFGYGPLAVGSRWLAYASNKLLVSNTGHLSPKNLTPCISPSTSPSNGSLVARYAMESSKQLAAGIITLGDKGYKRFSKYYPEKLQDRPISPRTSNPGWKIRNASPEVDTAGTVIVKDVVTEAVISQFRAHSSPLSALCFDPSGTLLVTASIHGNNVNIFRIMPCIRSGSTHQNHDWNSSHVLLYKLHRGITSAVIQDINFSHFSQWISIVSSKGTCHVFVLSPFGGDARYQTHAHLAINPVRSLPWWSTPSFVIDEPLPPPPAPLTLSVVGRIRNNGSGFLNSVSNATSFVGKTIIPSGVVASIFHNSMTYCNQNSSTKVNSLEYLLVYTPSGYVIQYELLPSMGIQHIDVGSRTQSVSYQPGQDEELGVIFESRQWWQVCRRLDSPEREECISTPTFNTQESANLCVGSDSVKRNDGAHWFLSNAEVQINSGRLPVWQNTKVHFYAMRSVNVEDFAYGEDQIENIPCYEVDIRRKDLLPVFDHFNSLKSGWDDRTYSLKNNPGASSLETGQCREKASDESVICLSKPASVSSTESSDGGSSRRIENLLDLDPVNCEKSSVPISHTLNELYLKTKHSVSPSLVNQNPKGTSFFPSELYPTITTQTDCNSAHRTISTPLLTTDHFDIKELACPSTGPKKPVDFEGCFQEGYYKAVEPDGGGKLTGDATDYYESNGTRSGRETSENEGDEDELLGGMFDLSEEG